MEVDEIKLISTDKVASAVQKNHEGHMMFNEKH
jgi:hypothetical protein